MAIKLTPKQERELFHWHPGAGFLAYKSGPNLITYTEFFISRKTGLPHYIKSGTPVEFHFEEEE